MLGNIVKFKMGSLVLEKVLEKILKRYGQKISLVKDNLEEKYKMIKRKKKNNGVLLYCQEIIF